MLLTYFKDYEFAKCVPSCDISQMNEDFLEALEAARSDAMVPFVLTSAFRSSDYDRKKGRSGNGFHTKGRAVDIACSDSVRRARIVSACLAHGLTCGIAKTFIHVDNRNVSDGYLFPLVFLY